MAHINHNGPGHADVELTLGQRTRERGAIFQTWTICECSLPRLRAHLGPPHRESVHTLESLRATGNAIMQTPGAIHFGGEGS